MDINALHKILAETTTQFRKGPIATGSPELLDAIERGDETLPGGVAEFYFMPHADDAPNGLAMVDCSFIRVGVDQEKAAAIKNELIALLNEYPEPERFSSGPSYIEVGGVIGDQGAALALFALGKVLGLWGVITPEGLGFSGEEERRLAGSGFVMITGYAPKRA